MKYRCVDDTLTLEKAPPYTGSKKRRGCCFFKKPCKNRGGYPNSPIIIITYSSRKYIIYIIYKGKEKNKYLQGVTHTLLHRNLILQTPKEPLPHPFQKFYLPV